MTDPIPVCLDVFVQPVVVVLGCKLGQGGVAVAADGSETEVLNEDRPIVNKKSQWTVIWNRHSKFIG